MATNVVCTSDSLFSQWQAVEKQYQIYGSCAFFFYTMTKNSILLPSSVMTGGWHYYALQHIHIFEEKTTKNKIQKHTLSLFLK